MPFNENGFLKYTVVEYTDQTREDEEGCALKWRVTDQNGGKWHIEQWDSYHGSYYSVEGLNTYNLLSDALVRLKEIISKESN